MEANDILEERLRHELAVLKEKLESPMLEPNVFAFALAAKETIEWVLGDISERPSKSVY